MPKRIAIWNPARDVWEDEKGGTSLFCGHSDVFSGTFPGSGMTRNGVAYELRTWERRMGDTGSSSSPDDETDEMLPTPTAVYGGGTPEAHLARKPGRSKVTDLRMVAEYDLLRTPCAAEDEGGPLHPDVAKERGQTLRLTGQILALSGDLLPTPRSSDTNGAGRHGAGGADLRTVAAEELLPTPRASDGPNGGPGMRGSKGDLPLPAAVCQLLPTPQANIADNGGSQDPAKRLAGGHSVSIQDVAEHELMPTPVTQPMTGNGHARNLGAEAKKLMPNQSATGEMFGRFAPAIHRWETVLGRPAPAPTERTGRKSGARLSPRFVEWMMGLPEGWVTDTAIGLTRSQQLKALGNGVVPQQGAAAIADMLDAFERTPKETTP